MLDALPYSFTISVQGQCKGIVGTRSHHQRLGTPAHLSYIPPYRETRQSRRFPRHYPWPQWETVLKTGQASVHILRNAA